MMMMESPVGTTYELRSHSLLPVGPRMTDKADSCGELSHTKTLSMVGSLPYVIMCAKFHFEILMGYNLQGGGRISRFPIDFSWALQRSVNALPVMV